MNLSSEYEFLSLSPQEIRYINNYYSQLLYSFNLQRLYDPEDIFQEILAKAEKVINDKQEIKKPLAWAKMVGLNTILQYNRREKSHRKYCQKLKRMMQSEVKYELSEDIWFEDTWGTILAEALRELQNLKPDFYRILMMRFLHDLSWKQISSVLYPDTIITKQISNKLRRRGSRAVAKLRAIFWEKISAQPINCNYFNSTESFQLVKVNNDYFDLERVVLPSKKIFFQAPANAYLEIFSYSEVIKSPPERILCRDLCTDPQLLQYLNFFN